MISKKQLFSFLILATVGVFSVQQNISAATTTSTSSLVATADVSKMPIAKVHLSYRAIMVTNISAKDVTLDSVNINLNGKSVKDDGDLISNRVRYCDSKTTDMNDAKYCAYNNAKATDVCESNHMLKSGESCFVWFKALRNDKIGVSTDSMDHKNFTLVINTKSGDNLTKHFVADYQQDLYVAGDIKDPEHPNRDTDMCGLYVWDGIYSSWVLMAYGESQKLGKDQTPLALMKGDLYIGAVDMYGFGAVNGPTIKVHNIAEWNGYSWLDVNGGVGFNEYDGTGYIESLATVNDELYVGGFFDHADVDQNGHGKIETGGLAKWDGSNWSAVGDKTLYNVVSLGEVKNKELYAVGRMNGTGDVLAKWHDSKWDIVNSGDLTIAAFANVNSDYYMSQNGQIQKLQGDNNWQTIGKINGLRDVWAITGNDGVIYVGGHFDGVDGTHSAGLAQLTSSGWRSLGDFIDRGDTGEVTSLAYTNHELYAGGKFDKIGNASFNKVAKWNGSSWSSFDKGLDFYSHAHLSFIIAPSLTIIGY